MAMNKFFLHQIKHNPTNDTIDKGIVVKDTYSAAKQSYHAYLGAYAYDHDQNTDYVACYITDSQGVRLMWEIWEKAEPEPEPENVPETEE